MKKITHKKLNWVIKQIYEKKIPLFIHGTFGIGKSDVCRATAKELGVDFIDVRLSQLEPSDIRGLPTVETIKVNGEEKEKVTKWLPPNFLPRDKNTKAIILLDELNTSPPSVQAQAYELILDRRCGDYTLPDGIVIIGAGNTIEDKANIFEMATPLLNRFTHTELSIPTIDEWNLWAFDNKVDGRIIGYLTTYPNRLFGYNQKNKDKAINTPRTWEFTSRLIDGVTDLKDIELLSSSAVGEGVAVEFVAFLSLNQKIDIEGILKNPKNINKIKELDVKYSVITAINEYFKRKKTKENLERIYNVCKEMEVEFSTILLKMMLSVDYKFIRENTKEIKGGETFLQSYIKYLHE